MIKFPEMKDDKELRGIYSSSKSKSATVTNADNNIKRYVILLSFIKIDRDDDCETFEEANDIELDLYFNRHSFIICKGMDNLKLTFVNLLKNIDNIDLDNSVIISDAIPLSKSLGLLGDEKNSLIKFAKMCAKKNPEIIDIVNEYIDNQYQYELDEDLVVEHETLSNDDLMLLEEVNKLPDIED